MDLLDGEFCLVKSLFILKIIFTESLELLERFLEKIVFLDTSILFSPGVCFFRGFDFRGLFRERKIDFSKLRNFLFIKKFPCFKLTVRIY